MSHFAKVQNGTVINVIVAEQDFIDSYNDGVPGEWIKTSYNTIGGVHLTGGEPLRKNFAAIGMIYDSERDAFYATQPYPSWILNEETCLWEAPVEPPKDNKRYVWDESTTSWVQGD